MTWTRLQTSIPADLLKVRSVVKSSSHVYCYNLLELTLDIEGTYSSPFNPNEISVDGHFTSPGGKEITVPGFLYQDYEFHKKGGIELLRPKGNPQWKVRFSPREQGVYSFYVTAKDFSGSVRSEGNTFTAKRFDNPGYIRVSIKDPRYFELGGSLGSNHGNYLESKRTDGLDVAQTGLRGDFWCYFLALRQQGHVVEFESYATC